MLLREYARTEGVGGVAGQHRDPGLGDDGSAVERLGDEVHRAAVLGHAGGERPLVRAEPRKGGKQGGMDVDEPSREPGREAGAEDVEEAGEHDQVRPAGSGDAVYPSGEGLFEAGGRAAGPAAEAVGGDAGRLGPREGGDAALVVVSLPPERVAEEQRRFDETPDLDSDLKVTVIDQATHETILRLAGQGLISLSAGGDGGAGGPGGGLREVYPGPDAREAESEGRALRARTLADQAKHKLKAATLLEGGGFPEEARAPAVEAARLAAGAAAALRGEPEPADADSAAAFLLREGLEGGRDGLPRGAVRVLSGDGGEGGAVAPVGGLLDWVSSAIGDASDGGAHPAR